MLDKKFLLANQEVYEISMQRRGAKSDYATFIQIHQAHKSINEQLQNLREKQNKLTGLSNEAKAIKEEISQLSKEEKELDEKLTSWLSHQPNIILDEVPDGALETDHKQVFSTAIPTYKTKPHYDLIENLVMKEEAANLSGSRFVVFKSELSNLKRALVSFLLEHNQANGYEAYEVPYIVNKETLFATGQLPKFAEDAFQLTNSQWLISTGEVPLVNLFANKVLSEIELPKLVTTYSPCFRSEAGSASRDTKGLIRLHQFHKVELVSICKAEDAEFYHQKQLETAKAALEKLDLPYRVILICAGDMGFTATKQYDIEVWMPGSERFLEIASCSQCGTFQAIRANIKYKSEGKNQYAHTLNGSSLPIERLIAALIETHYKESTHTIQIPSSLAKHLGKAEIQLI